MGIARFSKSGVPPWLGIAVALALCAVAGFVTFAVASNRPAPKPVAKNRHVDRNALAPILDLVREPNPLAALASRRVRLSGGGTGGGTSTAGAPVETPTPTSRRRGRPSKPLSTRVFAVAADWPYTYALTSAKPYTSAEDDAGPFLGVTLVRRNAVTGERTKLMRIRRDIPLVLRAGGGRAMLWQIGFGGRHLSSRILAFDHDSTTPETVVSNNITVDLSAASLTGGFCGRFSTLTGVDDAGEALVTRLTMVCTTEKTTDADLETVAIARDGATRVLDSAPSVGALFAGRTVLAGSRLLQTGPLVTTIAQVDMASGERSLLWNSGAADDATIAGDGSVAIKPSLVGDGFDYSPSAARLGPGMLVFPRGDADHPETVDKPNATSVAVHYCGTRLYELQTARRTSPDSLAEGLSGFSGGLPVVSRIEVIERDVTGGAPRRLALTGKSWVRSLACDGETLLLATSRGANVRLSRFGP